MFIQNQSQQRSILQLNEDWKFALDPENQLKPYEQAASIPQDCIQTTRSWEEQGFGTESTHYPIGTWKKKREYEGVGWYVKDVEIPENFADKKISLTIKGVRWLTECWVDGAYVGRNESLVNVHRYDLTSFVQVGKTCRIVIRVDTTMKYDLEESHIHSYHTATNWGGITGGIDLEAHKNGSVEEVLIHTNSIEKSIRVKVKMDCHEWNDSQNGTLAARVLQTNGDVVATQNSALIQNTVIDLQLGEDAILWSPKNPYLYILELEIQANGEQHDLKRLTFGLRTIESRENQILLNGQPIFLTGYVDCCVFPQTGYPVWDLEYYKKQFRTIKSYGFNHVRLHGWNPPEPFWDAADQVGLLVQTELPHWSSHYRNRNRNADEQVREFLKKELIEMIRNLQHHPSFVMLSMGNELISEEGHPQLNELVKLGKELDPSRLYTDNTGFGELPAHDRGGDFYIPTLNWHPPYHIDNSASPDTTLDFREVTRMEKKPLIAHEHGQFTMYVRPEEKEKYKGILKPSWLETINDTLSTKKLDSRVEEFIEATGVHLIRTLKEAMEKARRTPGLSGIQLLDVRDFPGQGHATVGILDVFGDSKGIIDERAFRQFNEQTVLLMRTKRRTYFNDEHLCANLEVSHFGQAAQLAELHWVIESENQIIEEGDRMIDLIPGDGLMDLTKIQVHLPAGKARKLTLKSSLKINGEMVTNEWDIWAFPRYKLPENPERIWTNIHSLGSILYGARREGTIGLKHYSFQKEENVDVAITNQLSRDVFQFLVDGGSVWLMAQEGYQHDEVHTKYLPIFWNYLWFPQQRGTTMGILNHKHPGLKDFPNDRFSEWLWFHLVDNSVALGMDLIPQVEPIVEVIDNFNRAKRLAYAYEVQVGRGKLFVSSFNFMDRQTMKLPEVQGLFFQLLEYLKGADFQPKASLTVGELLGIFKVSAYVDR